MSLSPFFFDYEQPRRPCRLLDQHFGLGLTPEDFLTVLAVPQRGRDYYRPWRNQRAAAGDEGSTIKADKNNFQINLDVQHFAPEEISVKIVDGFLVVEAKHEEKQDEHGYISRSFSRRYMLPKGVQADLVASKLSSDGVLSITAPLKSLRAAGERVIPILHTGPVKQVGEGEKKAVEAEKKE